MSSTDCGPGGAENDDCAMRTDFLDFPTAWKIQNEVGPTLPHDELCSAVYSPAFLCDCGAVPNEWARRVASVSDGGL